MRKVTWAALIGLGLSLTGCELMHGGRELADETVRTLKPKSSDYRDTTEEESDEWAFVGRDARGNRPREQDPDPWWQRFVMSEKARSIESNLGIAEPGE